METRTAQVPVSLLLDPGISASAKLIWTAQRLEPNAGPADLERLTCLSRNTILTGLAHLKANAPTPSGSRVSSAPSSSRWAARL